MKLKSTYALLDVERGRRRLEKIFSNGKGGYGKNRERVPVIITGYITHQHGDDDGVSIEFGVDVVSVEVGDVEIPK